MLSGEALRLRCGLEGHLPAPAIFREHAALLNLVILSGASALAFPARKNLTLRPRAATFLIQELAFVAGKQILRLRLG